MIGARNVQIALDLGKDVLQRRRHRHTGQYRETQAMRLTGAVVRILPEDDDLYLFKRRGIQRREDLPRRRIDRLAAFALVQQELAQTSHPGLVEGCPQAGLPARLKPDAVFRPTHVAAVALRSRIRRPTRSWKISLVMRRRSSMGFCTRSLAPTFSSALWLAGLSSPVMTRIGNNPLP